jgi:hypothetical protein
MSGVLPINILAAEISSNVRLTQDPIIHFKTTVWEDTAGAYKLATMEPEKMTPRSRWYGIKYHWLRIKLKPNIIDIIKIASADLRPSVLTKSLCCEVCSYPPQSQHLLFYKQACSNFSVTSHGNVVRDRNIKYKCNAFFKSIEN